MTDKITVELTPNECEALSRLLKLYVPLYKHAEENDEYVTTHDGDELALYTALSVITGEYEYQMRDPVTNKLCDKISEPSIPSRSL